jgi:CrcB protein
MSPAFAERHGVGVFCFVPCERRRVRNYALVLLGGGLGAVARYWTSNVVYRWLPADFPYGNLVVNISACFLIGLVVSGLQERFLVSPALRVFLTIGILGGYSTFSSFSYETLMLMRDGELFRAFVNIGISVGVGLMATAGGMIIGKLL